MTGDGRALADFSDIAVVLGAGLEDEGGPTETTLARADAAASLARERDIAFIVDDVDAAYSAALERGATSFRSPVDDVDETGNGTIRHAAISTYGETVHTFVDRSGYRDGALEPGYAADIPRAARPPLRDSPRRHGGHGGQK